MTAIRVTARPFHGSRVGGIARVPTSRLSPLRLCSPPERSAGRPRPPPRRLCGCERATPVEARDTTAARDCARAPGVGGVAVGADVGGHRFGRRSDGERRAARPAPDVDDVQRRMLGQEIPSCTNGVPARGCPYLDERARRDLVPQPPGHRPLPLWAGHRSKIEVGSCTVCALAGTTATTSSAILAGDQT